MVTYISNKLWKDVVKFNCIEYKQPLKIIIE
jgi:hypothetical protein